MKLFRESIIILGIYLISEFISRFFNLPIPGNILGMLVLLVLLITKIIKVEQIETLSNFFLDHLAFFFIPAGVGLMSSAGIIKDSWLRIILVCVITTIIVMAATGITVQFISRKISKRKGSEVYEHTNK
jgi:holin-like protein